MNHAEPPGIPPLPRRSHAVSVTLTAHFEKLIATGQLAPGDKLPPERELAASLAVSRSSLREAMYELESKRLVERVQGRGTVVLGPLEGVDELLALGPGASAAEHAAELRSIIEPSIAALAAHRATAANLLQLHGVLERSSEKLRAAESLALDIEFHQLLAQAAQNPLLTTLQHMASEWTGDVRGHSHASKEGRRASTSGHEAILRAVMAHDGAAARQAMEAHLLEVREIIEKATKK